MISLSNLILIDISFLILLIIKRDFTFFKNKTFKYLLVLYLYLIINSFLSMDPNLGINRNLGFIRIIIFFLSINYFYLQKDFFNKVFGFWSIIFLFVVFDILVESIFGKNIFGYGGLSDNRIYSFFKDEAVVGSYLLAFFLIIFGFFLNKYKQEENYFIFFLASIYLIAIFLTGERASSIKAFISILCLFLIYKELNLKKKFILVGITLISLFVLIVNSEYLKLRFVGQLKAAVLNVEENQYFYLYKSGFEVFKNNPTFGVGNKNYRLETCKNIGIDNKKNYFCSTHPHQVYFEFLSEHGLLGTLIVFYLLYSIIFSKWKIFLLNFNYIQFGSFVYLTLVFLPIIPTGAFFSDFSLTLFAINLSFLYASNSKTNIFQNN